MNLFTYSLTFLTLRLNSVTCKTCLLGPFYDNIGSFIPLTFVNAMGFHMAYVQYSITTLVSLNRLSVLVNYNFMEPIWKKYTWFFILIIYVVPFLNTHIAFKYEAKSVYYNGSGEYYSIEAENLPRDAILSVVIPFTVIATVISVAVNITSICIVHNLKTQIRGKAEANFLVIMSITCAVQVLGTSITVALSIMQMSPFVMNLVYALPYVSDGLTLIQPWLLVCFSYAMRQQVKMSFGWEPNSQAPSNQLFQMRSNTS